MERKTQRRVERSLRLIDGGQAARSKAAANDSPLVAAAREEVRRRSDRRLVLGPDLLGEPAWDMLLDLYLARATTHRVAVSSLCIASGVPTTTALRWIRTLEQQGLVLRERDRDDARRSFVDLTPAAREKMELLLRRTINRGADD